MADATAPSQGGTGSSVPKIAGVCALKGLAVYAATFTFAGLYGYFIVKISTATGKPPELDSVLVTAAAALAGVLGSAFALEVGIATPAGGTNAELGRALDDVQPPAKPSRQLRLRQLLSLEPSHTSAPSWPKTIGIWVYAVVAAAVAITYALNQNETPQMIQALAVAFAGYILALLTAAYRDITPAAGTSPDATASAGGAVIKVAGPADPNAPETNGKDVEPTSANPGEAQDDR